MHLIVNLKEHASAGEINTDAHYLLATILSCLLLAIKFNFSHETSAFKRYFVMIEL